MAAMKKHYLKELGMRRSIYQTFSNGLITTRVVIRDLLNTEDLKQIFIEARKRFEIIKTAHEAHRLRKEYRRNFYKRNSNRGTHIRMWKTVHRGYELQRNKIL
jgi:hypothetical protein